MKHPDKHSVGQKQVEFVPVPLPPESERVSRDPRFANVGERRTRYSMPEALDSPSPVGYRTRVSLSPAEAEVALGLLSMERPSGFAESDVISEQALFEEVSLGVLSSRQSTNYRGHRQVTLGPKDSRSVTAVLREMSGIRAPVLDGAAMTHVVFSRPYRTPFTMLLTLAGHKPVASVITVPLRAWQKRTKHIDDIPTIGYLQHLHIGVLAECLERASVVASSGRRRSNVILAPFSSGDAREANADGIVQLEKLCGLTAGERSRGWRIAAIAQVGEALPGEGFDAPPETWRRLGAALLGFRSERIQPGVNFEEKAPPQYHHRQAMNVPDALTVQAGRAAYNAFAQWTLCDRKDAKSLLLLDRIDVLTPGGKKRLRDVRDSLHKVTDDVIAHMPWWADMPTGRVFSRNANRGRKAFALAGQRIYVGGLARAEVDAAGLDWELAVRATGAAAARSALVAEICGSTEIPADCDLRAGICLMAGPVNQNDIGKQFYGQGDLLEQAYEGRDPTSLLVWSLKAKTVADPIGNEEQLLNPKRKGALVDLRPGPHEVVTVRRDDGSLVPLRQRDGRVNGERAFGDVGNFVTTENGREIPGNRGSKWPSNWSAEVLWQGEEAP